jgi:hypothetical protein
MNSVLDKKVSIRRISDLTDEEITTFINNYFKRKVSTGGIFTLEELLIEQAQRLAKQWNIPGLLRVILENRQVGDGLTEYKALWHVMFPDQDWKGRYSLWIVMEVLDAMNRYSVALGLPLYTALVVPCATRRLTRKAIENLYDRARELGRDVGPDVDSFLDREQTRALAG